MAQGVAGYVSPYPYLDRLQEKMEEVLARTVPAEGRFCGFCYGRLRPTDAACPYCGHDTAAWPPANAVPPEVLSLYRLKQRREARWVHSGAMFGLTVAALLFVVLVTWAPGILGHPATAFAVLIGGGYLLAQLFGTLIGAQIGYRSGARRRDAAWARFLAHRDSEPTR